MEKSESVELMVNYPALFKQFMQAARMELGDVERIAPEALSPVRRLLVALNIAVNSIDSPAALDEFRAQMSAIASRLAQADDTAVRIGQEYVYDSHDADSKLNRHSGYRVRVIRQLTDDVDDAEVGPMYRVTLVGSHVSFDAFADELRKAH